MTNVRCNRSSVVLVAGMVSLLALACGSKSVMRDGGGPPGTGGPAGTAQTVASGGNPGTGGRVGSGGSLGTGGGNPEAGGWVANGGGLGTDGGASDVSTQVACSDDGGVGLPAAARQCTQDSDCAIVIVPGCCARDQALGEAKSQASTYAGCLGRGLGTCDLPLCGMFYGYTTDTGRITPVGDSSSRPIDYVSVHCLNQLCTTDVVDGQDARLDAAPVTDVTVDLASQACGDTACGPRQVCVLMSGGAMPRCEPQGDGGVCSLGLVPIDTCSSPGGTYFRPGCTDPRPTPKCFDLPDACGDVCSCVCHISGSNAGCFQGPGYMICSYP
jgi:hypothetical protein